MKRSDLIPPNAHFSFNVTSDEHGARLDSFLQSKFPGYSRTFIQGLFAQNCVTYNDTVHTKVSTPVKTGDTITITFPPEKKIEPPIIDRDLGVKIAFEHEHFLIINKPAGLLVHRPSPKSTELTLVEWLLANVHGITSVGYADRPGIVHRLDKDTSGLLIIPRTPYAHMVFGKLFKERALTKTYLAIVQGHPERKGTIDYPIARDKLHRNKMIALSPTTNRNKAAGTIRPALTEYTVQEYFEDTSLIKAHLITGRTHQIRVHFAALGHPLIGDTVYGKESKLIKRQALHAYSIAFTFDDTPFYFEQDPPKDMQKLIALMRKNRD